MLKKSIYLVAAVLASALLLTACGDDGGVKKADPSVEVPEEAATNSEGEVLAITGDLTAVDPASNVVRETTTVEKETTQPATTKAADEEAEKETEADDIVQPTSMLDETILVSVTADGEGLMFRKGPASTYEDMGAITDGTELTIEAVQDGWGYTSYGGSHGWVSMDFVTEVTEF